MAASNTDLHYLNLAATGMVGAVLMIELSGPDPTVFNYLLISALLLIGTGGLYGTLKFNPSEVLQ